VWHLTLYIASLILSDRDDMVRIFFLGIVTDLVSRGYLVFSVRVGVRTGLAHLARCNMLLLLMYIDQQLCM